MSLINSVRNLSRIGLKEGTRYRAIITDNKDPKQLGRVKFIIPKFFEFDIKDSPWAIPQNNGADGAVPAKDGSTACGSLNIPRIGSYVDIIFNAGSVYNPAYLPTSVFKTVQMPEAQINYPDRKIEKLSNGTYLIIDERANSVEFFNPGDTAISSGGSTYLKVGGTCNLTVDGDVVVTSKKGNVSVSSETGNVVARAIKGNAEIIAGGDISVTSETGKILLIGQNGLGPPLLGGLVTGNHNCHFDGAPHNDCSLNVFAT